MMYRDTFDRNSDTIIDSQDNLELKIIARD